MQEKLEDSFIICHCLHCDSIVSLVPGKINSSLQSAETLSNKLAREGLKKSFSKLILDATIVATHRNGFRISGSLFSVAL